MIEGNRYFINVYFKTQCTAKVTLVLLLDRSSEFDCCDDNSGISPDIIEKYDGTEIRRFLKTHKVVPCGEKCCKKVYTIDIIRSLSGNLKATTIDRNTYSVSSNCGGDYPYPDCLDGTVIPCEEGSCE